MSEPDTNVMRATYATAATYRQSPDTARAAEFGLWLAGVKADAWDEGYRAGSQDMSDLRAGRLTFQTITSNPYRQEADHA